MLTVNHIRQLIRQYGLQALLGELTARIKSDFSRWDEFSKSERHATHFEHGVLELMPCSNQTHYSFKFINGHPGNIQKGLPSIVSLGVLAEVETGMPILVAEMGIMTALRTAAVTALGARYLARSDSQRIGIIGCGAQAEFQLLALANEFLIEQVKYLDIDPQAEEKFARNLSTQSWEMDHKDTPESLLEGIDILVTATAARKKAVLFRADQVTPGMHIHALGGDCPGKTELPPELIDRATVIVEYLPQTRSEGEIQNRGGGTDPVELHQLIRQNHPGRQHESEITLFDAVGFALEDFSALMLLQELAAAHDIGESIQLLAIPPDPKNLYGYLYD
ncbi:MAG: ornithine cyclodeaminase [Candidatus Thiodiazotropha lotti]|nr:ornithine cyclodeaminase [Candidatus Thiodiazotropha lotti]MCW4222845.1 ornithine cyclodeaminase [Candidatus Thiodiazotropha lotti]